MREVLTHVFLGLFKISHFLPCPPLINYIVVYLPTATPYVPLYVSLVPTHTSAGPIAQVDELKRSCKLQPMNENKMSCNYVRLLPIVRFCKGKMEKC